MHKFRKLDDLEFIDLVKDELLSAELHSNSVSKERQESLEYYNRERPLPEGEGSKYIASDCYDSVEWTLADLVNIFLETDIIVEFEPESKEDVEQAELETKVCNYVFWKQNAGFMNVYTWLKDGLIQKNGILKAYWDEKVEAEREEYTSRSYEDYLRVAEDDEIRLIEVKGRIDKQELSLEEAELAFQQGFPVVFDFIVERRHDVSQVRLENIPPEDYFIERGHNTLDPSAAMFQAEKRTVPASDLIIDGFAKSKIQMLPSAPKSRDIDAKGHDARDDGQVHLRGGDNDSDTDAARRMVDVYECYIRSDKNGDGETELYQVFIGGHDKDLLLDYDKVDSTPYCAWTPVVSPHLFYGKSRVDEVRDLQNVRSVLMRQMLNNAYLSNMPKMLVEESSNTEIDALQGGVTDTIVMTSNIGGVTPLVVPYVGDKMLPLMDLLDRQREDRTGLSAQSKGMDASAISNSTNMVGMEILTRSQMRNKMIARLFAETGFKQLFLRIHELLRKHASADWFLDFGDGDQSINPREWRKRRRLKIKVGLGHAGKIDKLAGIQNLMLLQEKIAAVQGGGEGPLLSLKNIYNSLDELTKQSGLMTTEKYFSDPETYVPPPKEAPALDKALDIEEAKVVTDSQAKAAHNEIEQRKLVIEERRLALEEMKIQADVEINRAKLEVEMMKINANAEVKLTDTVLKGQINEQSRTRQTAEGNSQ